ncbi:MAG: metal ABC transporter permease [Oscillospiraceae bacterium]|jgi:zinc transport system permease protein|nr:metal ABC transporter permease [Oscillospiraceae bacterium]
MIDLMRELFSYPFLVRALISGALVSLCSALLGVPLVLKRYSMIGDGLSHVGFGALAIASALNWAPLYVAIPTVAAAAFLLLRLTSDSRVNGDGAIALISTGSLAVGVIVISASTGMNTEISNYLFGSILSMTPGDVRLSAAAAAVVLALFILFYGRIFAVTFDETFARAIGVRAGVYNTLIALLTALTITVGMRIMGSLLISGLIIFPALSSMRLCRSFRGVMICSCTVSLICFFVGVAASYALALPTGASVVCADAAVFALFCLTGALLKRNRA